METNSFKSNNERTSAATRYPGFIEAREGISFRSTLYNKYENKVKKLKIKVEETNEYIEITYEEGMTWLDYAMSEYNELLEYITDWEEWRFISQDYSTLLCTKLLAQWS